METNTSEMSSGTGNQQQSTTVKLELSEYDNPVPFKVIKLEPEEAPHLFPMTLTQEPGWTAHCSDQGPSNTNNTGYSKLPQSVSLNRDSTSFCDVKTRKRYGNEISSDESSSESDIGLNNDSDADSVSECWDDSSEIQDVTGPDEQDDGVLNDTIITRHDRPPNREWTTDPTSIKKIEFTKKQELRISPPQTPYEAFRWFLNDEIIDILVQETNKYAARVCKKSSISPQSRIKAWKDLNHKEMTTFLALLIHSGTFRTNMLGDYWKTDYLFNWMCFSKYIRRNRFMLILNFLNFASPTGSRDSRGQIHPIISNFNAKMSEIYYPGMELFLANRMVLRRGRLIGQQCEIHNLSTDVINLYMLAEPNGIVNKYQVYSSKTKLLRATTGEIVKGLLEDYLGNGHAVYMNRCYSSWILVTKLLGWQTYCTGILNKNSRDNLFTDTTSDLPKQGNQSLFLNGVHIGKWNDNNKSVLYISTEFDNEIQEVVKEDGTKISRPKAIMNYCKHMTDSELQEQLMSYYPCRRKSVRWSQTIFIHGLQIYMNNAYHLYNNYSGKDKLSFYDFRVAVLKAMLPEPKMISMELAETHVLTKITNKITRNKRAKDGEIIRQVSYIVRKKCILCVDKQKNTNTIYECRGCEGAPGFCASCFCQYHSSKIPPNTYITD